MPPEFALTQSAWLLALMLFWALALLVFLFRRGAALAWKAGALFLFVFYVLWLFADLERAIELWFAELSLARALDFLAALGELLPALLLVAWPLALLLAGVLHSRESASKIVRNLLLVTLFYWLFWFLIYFTGSPLEYLRIGLD